MTKRGALGRTERSAAIARDCAKKGGRPWYPDFRTWAVFQLEDLKLAIELELDRRVEEKRREDQEEAARRIVYSRPVWQHNRCGKPGCRCASGELHGPYLYIVETFGDGRARKRYATKQERKKHGHP